MGTFYQDLRFGWRVLAGNPGYTAVAVLTLAIGIAAGTTVFGWIDAALLRPLPGVTDGQSLLALEITTPGWNSGSLNLSYNDYRFAREHLKLLSGVAAHELTAFNVGDVDRTQRTWGELVSGNYFSVMGVAPLLGRVFRPEEYADKPGAFPVAVISERLWRNRFNSDPGIVGRKLFVNRCPLTIVGVVPGAFRGTMPGLSLDIWVPLMMTPQLTGAREQIFTNGSRSYRAIARLGPGISIAQARSELQAWVRRAVEERPGANEGIGAALLPLWKAHSGAQSLLLEPLLILMAVCLLVLLVACANVANLQLARSVSRRREFGVRVALGASRSRVARQVLTESLLLAALGAVLGVTISMWLGRSLVWLLPPVNVPVGLEATLNGNILGFAVAICLAATLFSGLAPAVHSQRGDAIEALKEGGRSDTAGSRSAWLRNVLVASQFALALVALIGAALFVKSFRSVQAVEPGFDPANVSVAQFQPSASGYSTEQGKLLCRQLGERLRSSPGIARVAYSNQPPLGFGKFPWVEVEPEGRIAGRGENMRVYYDSTSPGYFGVMGIPQLEGRDFSERDTADAPPVMIVNESFAMRYFEGRYAIGQRVRIRGEWTTVIGLVKDCKYHSLAEEPQPFFYLPIEQNYSRERNIVWYVKSAASPDEALSALRRESNALDPTIAWFDAMPMTDFMGGSLYGQKVAASLLSILAALSLLLAAVGLYSVTAYSVTQRTHEIGIRMALGAESPAVIRMVVRQGLALAGVGLAAGFVASAVLTKLVSGMLVGVSTTDPAVFVGAPLFLAAVAATASCIPARRATGIDPIVALRCQ